MSFSNLERDPSMQATYLQFELQQPEAVLDPKPGHYQQAGHLLAKRFEAIRTGEVMIDPQLVDDSVDSVVSAVGGFYRRDIWTHNFTTSTAIGEHPSDIHLVQALQAAQRAEEIAEDNGTYKNVYNRCSLDTANTLLGLEASRLDGSISEGLRDNAADTLRAALRSVPLHVDTTDAILVAGREASLAIICLAPIAGLHQADGQAPFFKDYLAMHVSTTLKDLYS